MIAKPDSGDSKFDRAIAAACEQAVYGNFPFWDRGFGLLARSPGCRDEWIAEFKVVCGRLGDRPPGASESPSIMALRLSCGPYAIIGAFPQGLDDKGRPGAVSFHALFLSPREYRRVAANAFALSDRLRGDWTAEDRELPTLSATAPRRGVGNAADPRALRIAHALIEGRRVVVESQDSENALMRDVWAGLPVRVRSRRSFASRAFANGNRFDLLAVPRLAGVGFDSTYVLETDLTTPTRRSAASWGRIAFWLIVACFAIAVWRAAWNTL